MTGWWWWWLGCLILCVALVGGDYVTPEGTWPTEVVVVIHSCDDYRRYWPGMLAQWQEHASQLHPPPRVLFATETRVPDGLPVRGVESLLTGPGTWAQRLRRVLQSCAEPYVLYLQEDAWLTAPLCSRYVHAWLRCLREHRLLSLKLYANCQHRQGLPQDVNDPQWYLVSHQPSLWHREFLLGTLYDEQEAMAHELETNAMVHRSAAAAARCRCAQEYTSVVWPYVEVSRQGRVLPAARRWWQKHENKVSAT